MPASITVNLPVENVAASVAYYEALGFTRDPAFAQDTMVGIGISEAIRVMVFTRETFESLSLRPVPDPRKQIQCFHGLSCDSRAAVDAIADAAIAAGGSQHSPADDYEFMYSRPIADLDGHVWNYIWMDGGKLQAD